jgi:hypothetical protein
MNRDVLKEKSTDHEVSIKKKALKSLLETI